MLSSNHMSLSIAGWASFNVIWIICTSSSAMWTQNLLCNIKRHFASIVDILQRHMQTNFQVRTSSLRIVSLSEESTEHIKHSSLLIPRLFILLIFLHTFFSFLIVDSPEIFVFQNFVSSVNMLESLLRTSFFVFVRMIFQRKSAISFFDFFIFCVRFDFKMLVVLAISSTDHCCKIQNRTGKYSSSHCQLILVVRAFC